MVAEGAAELEDVGALAEVEGAKIWRNVWKQAQGASTSSTSGFRMRRRRLPGSSGLPASLEKARAVESWSGWVSSADGPTSREPCWLFGRHGPLADDRAAYAGLKLVLVRLACLGGARPLPTKRDHVNAPDRIRTCDLRFRRPTLYPTELLARARGGFYGLPSARAMARASKRIRRSWPESSVRKPVKKRPGAEGCWRRPWASGLPCRSSTPRWPTIGSRPRR